MTEAELADNSDNIKHNHFAFFIKDELMFA